MGEAQVNDQKKQANIEGLSYDGRKDKHTRASVVDKSTGKLKMTMVAKDHETITEEPSGNYMGHFNPEKPVYPEKPAFKVAQGLYRLLEQCDSVDSLKYLNGDSTPANTGHKVVLILTWKRWWVEAFFGEYVASTPMSFH